MNGLIKLKEIGLNSNEIVIADAPRCKNDDASMVLMGSNFKSKDDCIGWAISTCNDFSDPNRFFFIKWKDNTITVGINNPIFKEEPEYKWKIYNWDNTKTKYVKELNEKYIDVHYALVIQENEDGDFNLITE
ncbi:hypothetical protein CLRAG_33550 [Clostridium ragsdalei P11]|uniref:Uncharacterized protein n=1 Tax=Clostridium ragsdalei P11 TaxID=1353534 RepID=A0A1A6AKU7_9CLOT|nr:hypothetical protein [Clostridium ragsdalei]OBR90707.1 hypothetical protein CLRAG_33550 [Clostridium ragsdalei P11]